MNVFDMILYISLLWAVLSGLKRGFLLQLLALAAVVAALLLAAEYGTALGRALGIDGRYCAVAGFIILFLAVLLAAGIAGRMVRAVFRFAGLGAADAVLGAAFSVAKVLLIISVLFSWFDALNGEGEWVSRQSVEQSRWFAPVAGLTDRVTPWFEELKSCLND